MHKLPDIGKWNIRRVESGTWELRDHRGDWAYAGNSFEEVRQGFVVMARLAELSTSILRSQIERAARQHESNVRQRDTRNPHRFVQSEIPHTCYRCGGHRGNGVHEGFPEWPASWGDIVTTVRGDMPALTGQLPGMAGTVSLTALDGTITWAELDDEGKFSLMLPGTEEQA